MVRLLSSMLHVVARLHLVRHHWLLSGMLHVVAWLHLVRHHRLLTITRHWLLHLAWHNWLLHCLTSELIRLTFSDIRVILASLLELSIVSRLNVWLVGRHLHLGSRLHD